MPEFLRVSGEVASGDRCLDLGWVAVGRVSIVDALSSLGT